MSSPAQVSQYGPYIDLQNFTGSAAPGTSGSLWLSGSDASEILHANVGLNVAGTITGDTSLTLDTTTLTTAELAVLDGVTAGTATASKAVVLDASKNIATIGTIGCGAITSTGASSMGSLNVGGTLACDTSFTIDSTVLNATELGYVDGVTAGTAAASKAVVLDANGAVGTITHLTATYAKIEQLDVSTINSVTQTDTILEIEDKLIVSALSASSGNADGGGLRIGGGGQSAGHASVLWDDSNTAIDFNIAVGGAEVTQVRLTDGALLPETDSDVDLGSSALQFKDVHADAGYIDAITVTGTSTLTTVDINGGAIDGTAIGASSQSTAKFTTISGSGAVTLASTLTVQGNILPLVDNGCDLGASGTEFKDAFFDGTVTTDALVADTADINGGSVDGATIGASSQSSGQFTTVSGSGAATFASTVTAQGNILPLNDDEVDLGSSSKQFKDLYIDGAAYIDQLGEALDANSQNITNIGQLDVDGAASLNSTVTGSKGMLIADDYELWFGDDEDAYMYFDSTNHVLAMSGTVSGTVHAGAFCPSSGNAFDLGNSSIQWRHIFIDGTAHLDTVDIDAGNIDGTAIGANSQSTAKFTTVSGSGAATFASTLTVQGNILPLVDNGCDLGASGTEFKDAFFDGTVTTDALVADTADIDGGTVDGVVIGGASAGAGTFTTLDCTNGAFAVDNLDIDGATDISAALDTADLLIVDDGAGGTNRKSTFARVVTLMESEIDALGAVTFSGNVTVGSDANGYDVKFFGGSTDEYVLYDASEHHLKFVDGSGAEHLTIGGDANGEYAVDVASGSQNKNKIRAAAFVTYSDERLKSDVEPIRNALETVNSLSAVNFTWNTDGSRDFGFLAQDLKKSVPQAVHGTDEGLFGVDYGRLTAVLVSAIQEQSAQIKDLQAKLNKK